MSLKVLWQTKGDGCLCCRHRGLLKGLYIFLGFLNFCQLTWFSLHQLGLFREGFPQPGVRLGVADEPLLPSSLAPIASSISDRCVPGFA